jgi:hypothetical protein
MRMTESRLRHVIRSVINENMSNDFVPPGSYGEVEESQMTLEEMESMLGFHSFEQDHIDGYDDLVKLQKQYKNDLRSFVNDLIEQYGRDYGKEYYKSGLEQVKSLGSF